MPFRCLGPLVALLALPALVFAQTRTRPLDPQAAAEARQGWRAIEAGRAADAFGHFDAALARDPDVAPYQFGAGLAAYLLGRPEVARGRLEAALRLEPALTAASVLLGEILHQAGDLEGAIGVYEAARARAPADRQIAPRLDAWRAEASLQDSFQRSMSTNFTVLFEGPAEQPLAQKALELLEAAYWRIGGTLGVYPAEVITVVLYTREQFRDTTRSPGWAGGLYDGRIKVPMQGALEQPDELGRLLAHELTHALVRTLAPRGVPQWLSEGLASVFERGDLSWAESVVREAEALIPLDRLHGTFSGLSPAAARLVYAESALAARALLDQAGPAPLVALLTDLGNQVPFADAFSQRILIPYETFAADWAARVR